ncbi:uncharacterized protein LOC116417916 isoform X2 [Nasonia vitripennis]|uniref:Uncharacterized protein n=1 Tax=Nasonia vitripennis TaxID=7425 RepID=A0A7M7QPN8_NASVI|nr:uncharacterized protein LOC116417916 isoform X2 [Nasonia vitripennis]
MTCFVKVKIIIHFQVNIYPSKISNVQVPANDERNKGEDCIAENPTNTNMRHSNSDMEFSEIRNNHEDDDVVQHSSNQLDIYMSSSNYIMHSNRDSNGTAYSLNDNIRMDSDCTSSVNDSCSSNSSSNISSDTENKSYCFDKIMFNYSLKRLSVRDIILICTAFCLRFNISDQALLMLVNMFKICADPEFENLNFSKHMMSKCFSLQNENVTYHYYCKVCSEQIIYSVKSNKPPKRSKHMCIKCKKEATITSASENYFLTIDLAYQIEILFSNHETFSDVIKNVTSSNNEYKGTLHK